MLLDFGRNRIITRCIISDHKSDIIVSKSFLYGCFFQRGQLIDLTGRTPRRCKINKQAAPFIQKRINASS